MTHDQLRYALAVERFRSFSQAARNCGISQPSLSVQVANLEAELGLKIFHRLRAAVAPTSEGERLLKQARLVLDETSRLSQLADELKGTVRGKFRLGIIPTLSPGLLPMFLGRLRRKLPGDPTLGGRGTDG